ncbi:MAG: two-component regulator propeller domain-containing protein [Nitrospiria bacterium]
MRRFLCLLMFVLLFHETVLYPHSIQAGEASSANQKGLWNHFSLFSIVRALAFEGDVLWVGTSNGLLRYDLSTEEQQVYTTKDGLLSNMIHSITVGPNRVKWVGTYGGGLSRFDDRRWTVYTPYGVGSALSYADDWKAYRNAQGVGDLWVYGIHFDPKGVMWVATWKGVSRFDGKTFKTYTTEDGLIDKWVYTLSQDQTGVFWFGTEGGVTRYDGQNWRSYTHEDGVGTDVEAIQPPEVQSLPFTPRHHQEGGGKPLKYNPNYIVSSLVDAKNHLWVGTLGGGLSRFDGKSWTSYSTKDGLAGNMVHAIKIDAKGTLWIGTDGGVSRFDGKRFSNLGQKDGIGTVFSIAFDREGHKWFGTFGGVSQYRGN